MDAFRITGLRAYARIRVLSITATGPLLVVGLLACSAASKRPPQLGDCVPDGDIGCTDPGAGGAGVELATDAGSQSAKDAGAITMEGEAGTCRGGDGLLSPPCAPCIAAACCMTDSICAADNGCLVLLSCALSGTPCSASAASTTAYDDLQNCFEHNCSQQCHSIAPRDR